MLGVRLGNFMGNKWWLSRCHRKYGECDGCPRKHKPSHKSGHGLNIEEKLAVE